jgi:hypothetical protein
MKKDNVNHPSHYTNHSSGVECIDIVEHLSFNLGNGIKYLWRAGLKNDKLEDLKKAKWYFERESQRSQKHYYAISAYTKKIIGDNITKVIRTEQNEKLKKIYYMVSVVTTDPDLIDNNIYRIIKEIDNLINDMQGDGK